MSNIIAGMLAKSLAGHDKDDIYIIQRIEKDAVFLVNGRIRRVENPKKKNIKHIQPIYIEETQSDVMRNEAIRKLIKEYKKEHSI